MTISKTTLFFIVLAVVLNNFIWLYSVQDKNHSSVESKLMPRDQPQKVINYKNEDIKETNSLASITAVKVKNVQPTSINNAIDERTPEGINTTDIDIPQEV